MSHGEDENPFRQKGAAYRPRNGPAHSRSMTVEEEGIPVLHGRRVSDSNIPPAFRLLPSLSFDEKQSSGERSDGG